MAKTVPEERRTGGNFSGRKKSDSGMDATTLTDTGGTYPEYETGLILAERHRYGDPEAFETVYRNHSRMVYNMAWRMSGNADQAEDLTQEIFLRIYRHLGKFSGRSSLKTWVYRITINLCRTRLGRRRILTQSIFGDDDDRDIDPEDPRRDPEDLAVAEDLGRHLRRALLRVKPVFREAVVLRDLEELTYEEIAEILGVRLGTVRSRIARGREQLRVLLEASS